MFVALICFVVNSEGLALPADYKQGCKFNSFFTLKYTRNACLFCALRIINKRKRGKC